MDERILLFLHPPKTGGSSLIKNIYDQYASPNSGTLPDQLYHDGVLYYPGEGFFVDACSEIPESVFEVLKRDDLKCVVGHFCYGIHRIIPRVTTYATILRHPLDRVSSLYRHLYKDRSLSIRQFVEKEPWPGVDNDQTRRIAGGIHLTGSCTDETLEVAKENLTKRFEVVGTTENMAVTLESFRKTYRWKNEVYSYLSGHDPDGDQFELDDISKEIIMKKNEFDERLYSFAISSRS